MPEGKCSWYSQFRGKYNWIDTGDPPNSAALGCPDDAQGVSFYNNATLGKWFEVTFPNGVTSIEQQTDIGPAPWTGKAIDISAVCAERVGYSPTTFPTGAIVKWRSIDAPKEVAGLPAKQQATAYRDLRGKINIEPKVPAPEAKGGFWAAAAALFTSIFKGRSSSKPTGNASSLEEKLVAVMKKHNYKLFTASGEMNIIYVEGMSPEGVKNSNTPNEFNDARFVVTFENGKPKLVGAWQATTEPGKYWTEHRMNDAGAARIKFGQYTAWQVGVHHAGSASAHEALVQTGGKVTVCRDDNEDSDRAGDEEDTGFFGINQHWGYNLAKDDLGKSSAGCLVGRMEKGHKEFMALVKSDPRYKENKNFVFTAAVLPASEV